MFMYRAERVDNRKKIEGRLTYHDATYFISGRKDYVHEIYSATMEVFINDIWWKKKEVEGCCRKECGSCKHCMERNDKAPCADCDRDFKNWEPRKVIFTKSR